MQAMFVSQSVSQMIIWNWASYVCFSISITNDNMKLLLRWLLWITTSLVQRITWGNGLAIQDLSLFDTVSILFNCHSLMMQCVCLTWFLLINSFCLQMWQSLCSLKLTGSTISLVLLHQSFTNTIRWRSVSCHGSLPLYSCAYKAHVFA